MSPRKKKIDAESIQETETASEQKVGIASELEAEEKEIEAIDKDIVKKAEKLKEKFESKEPEEQEKPRKKKEIKKLSESELKRVMTDTKETLVPLTDYIACSVHLGTKVITPDMRRFVYKRRADGLAVLNTNLIDDKLREAGKFLADFAPEDVFVTCKREAGWPAVEKFSEVTGIRAFMKKYPAGIITNLKLETFFEPKLAILCDPWVDKNALHDAMNIGIPVLSICDSNNYTHGIMQIVPANNKSRKSIGLILFVLAREYLKALGRKDEAKELKMEDFTGKIEAAEGYESKSTGGYGSITSVGERAEEGV